MYRRVIGVRGELIGGVAVTGLILGDEALGQLVRRVRGEGGQQHDALRQGGVKAGHGEDAVHAVNTEELGGVAHGLGLARG